MGTTQSWNLRLTAKTRKRGSEEGEAAEMRCPPACQQLSTMTCLALARQAGMETGPCQALNNQRICHCAGLQHKAWEIAFLRHTRRANVFFPPLFSLQQLSRSCAEVCVCVWRCGGVQKCACFCLWCAGGATCVRARSVVCVRVCACSMGCCRQKWCPRVWPLGVSFLVVRTRWCLLMFVYMPRETRQR